MPGRSDKKLLFGTVNISNGADTNWDFTNGDITLYDNGSGEVNITIDAVDAEVSVLPGATNKYYYCMLFVTDPGGSVPAGLDGVTTAALQTWLTTYRRQIWMNAGGFTKYGSGIGDETAKMVPFAAETKRTLKPGQKLKLLVMAQNSSAGADTTVFCYDCNLFYHY
jgi:hypothetical protein